MEEIKTKICKKCGIEKLVDEFGKSSQYEDGLHTWCKQCMNIIKKRHRDKKKKEKINKKLDIVNSKKTCYKCGEEKTFDNYGIDKRNIDGLKDTCNDCIDKKKKEKIEYLLSRTTKVCSKCKIEKSIDEFSKDKNRPDGLCCQCKECISNYHLENKEEFNKKAHEYVLLHKDDKKEYNKKYRLEHKEEISNSTKEYYHEHREYLLQYAKEYRLANIDKVIQYKVDNYLMISVKRVVKKAKDKNIPYDNVEDLYNYLLPIYEIGICDCCKIELEHTIGQQSVNDNSYSIDRIIPEKGYTVGNVTILCHKCNEIKNNTTPDRLFQIANWYQNKLIQMSLLHNNDQQQNLDLPPEKVVNQ